jgi:biopolymer transport protein ExbB/TolQ
MGNILHIIEYIIVGIVIFSQIWIFFKITKPNIDKLSNIFPETANLFLKKIKLDEIKLGNINTTSVERYTNSKRKNIDLVFDETLYDGKTTIVDVDIIDYENHESEVFRNIILATNTYLLKNKNHAADFKILREVVENNTDSHQNQIESTIALPIYLGLLGTIVGVIFGLFALFQGNVIDEMMSTSPDGSTDFGAIKNFLIGVAIAMSASFTGLLLTIIHSGFSYKKAIRINDNNKNRYYTFLQTELLPILSKDMASSLNSLQANMNRFNDGFNENLTKFSVSINAVNENISTQKDFLRELRTIGFNSMVNGTIKIFKQLQKSGDQFDKFIQYQQNLNQTVAMVHTAIEQLYALAARFKTFEEGVNKTTTVLEEKYDNYNDIMDYIRVNMIEIEDRKRQMGSHLTDVDSSLQKGIAALQDNTENRLQFMNSYIQNLEEKIQMGLDALKDHTQRRIEAIDQITIDEQDKLQQTFENNRTKFDNLDYLKSLDTKMERLIQLQQNNVKKNNTNDSSLAELKKMNQIMTNILENQTKKKEPSKFVKWTKELMGKKD